MNTWPAFTLRRLYLILLAVSSASEILAILLYVNTGFMLFLIAAVLNGSSVANLLFQLTRMAERR